MRTFITRNNIWRTQKFINVVHSLSKITRAVKIIYNIIMIKQN